MKLIVIILVLLSVMQTTQSQIQSMSSGNWDNASTWVGNVVPNSSTTDIEIIGGHSITISSDVTIRNIIVTNGSLSIGSNKLQIHGNISGAQKANVSSNTNSTIEILGNSSVPQFEFTSSMQKLKKIVMNRGNGALSDHSLDLDDGVPADGIVLVLTNGILSLTNSSILYLNSKQIQADIPGSDSSHVDGIVQRNIPKNSGIYTFPVGDEGHFRPFGVATQNGNSDNINEVQFIWETPINNTDVNYNNLPGGIIQDFYWRHTVISGGNPQRRLSYTEEDFPNVSSAERTSSMTLANMDGTDSWDKATTPWTVDDNTKSIQFDNSNNSNSTYWTLGSISADVSYDDLHLPITLVDFSASLIDNNYIEVNWVTAQEQNSDYFVLLKSINGIDFTSLDTIAAAGFSSEYTFYKSIDAINGNSTLYYKFIQYDLDGKFYKSNIISVEIPINFTESKFETFPQNKSIYVQIIQSENQNNKVIISDIRGKTLFSSIIENQNQEIVIPIINSGIYRVSYISNDKIVSKSLFVK